MAFDLFGLWRQPVSSIFASSLWVVVSVALVATGCSSQRAYLTLVHAEDAANSENGPQLILPEGLEVGPETEITPPRPKEQEKTTTVAVSDTDTESVRLRFDIDAKGRVLNIRVVEATNDLIAKEAVSIAESWNFEPALVDGEAVEFRNIEAVMEFRKSENKIGSAIGTAAQAVVYITVILVAAASGSLRYVRINY